MARQDKDHLTIGHLLVVVGVDLGKQVFDFIFGLHDIHDAEKVFELDLADDAVLIIVH